MSSLQVGAWRVGLCVVMTVTAAGCTRCPQVAAPTVTYFREHADERRDQMRRCEDDPGTLGQTPACINAGQATAIEDVGSFRNLPPLGLPGAQPRHDGASAPATGTSTRP
jgi:hypothetical protein